MFLLTNNNIQWEEDCSSHSPKQSLQYRFSPHDEPAVPSGSPKKKQIPFSLHDCSCLTAGPVPASSGYVPIPFHTEPKNDTARDDSAAASATGSRSHSPPSSSRLPYPATQILHKAHGYADIGNQIPLPSADDAIYSGKTPASVSFLRSITANVPMTRCNRPHSVPIRHSVFGKQTASAGENPGTNREADFHSHKKHPIPECNANKTPATREQSSGNKSTPRLPLHEPRPSRGVMLPAELRNF